MTQMKKLDAVDKYVSAANALESAVYAMEVIEDSFFEKLDPDTTAGKLGFKLDFKRCRAFARIVMENLYRMQAGLPSIEQFDDLCNTRNDPE